METQMNGKTTLTPEQLKKTSNTLMDSSLGHEIVERYEATKRASTDAYQNSLDQVKENPITSIAVAVAVGAVAGYVLARQK